MSYSFLYTAAALLGLVTPMDQALMTMLENPSLERDAGAAALPPPRALPLRPRDGRWKIGADGDFAQGRRPVGYVLHLASYLGETWANRGWAELRRQSADLAGETPDFRAAEAPVLGPVVRVTVGRYASLAAAAAACARLRRQLDYCAPLPLFDP